MGHFIIQAAFCYHKQEISLKKIFGGSQILTILTQLNDEIPLYPLSLHAGKDVPSKTSEFGSCGYVSGLSFAWRSFRRAICI